MIQQVDRRLLGDLSAHTRKLGLKRVFQSMGYERCGELPLIVSRLEPLFGNRLRYLDIGSGESVFPSYVLKKTVWDVTCVDKFAWVEKQHDYAARAMNGVDYQGRLHILQQDFLTAELPAVSFDVITNISVIEHFEGESDTMAMKKSARLLKPGGLYVLTTLMNEHHFMEFFLQKNVYGAEYADAPIFFQRHYDVLSLQQRVLTPSALKERERVYFGEYGFQFFERVMDMPWPWKAFKLFYQWATPFFARTFLSYDDHPISREGMHMNTSSGVVVILEKAQ